MLASLMLLMAAEAATTIPVAVAVQIAEPDPKTMSRAQIKNFNASVPRSHPYYIRCVKSEETGSLVRKIYSCRTNEKWELADRTGNDKARDMMDAMRPKAAPGN